MSSHRLGGKVALITGVRSGIGAETARRLAASGARLMLANRTLSEADQIAQELSGAGHEARTVTFEATPAASARAVQATIEAYGGLDILIHNAGGCTWASLEALTPEILDTTLSLNLKCCFWLTQAALPTLKARGGGRILITSSVTGPRVAMADSAHYAASKAGVNGFIRAAAFELARHKITVNGVEPGFIAKRRGRVSQSAIQSRLERYIPLGRMGAPIDIAAAFLFLASDEASWITGQTLVVDGGGTLPETGYAMEELWERPE
jgi:3-oxoacyl-[acyl-carrier protein] reductase